MTVEPAVKICPLEKEHIPAARGLLSRVFNLSAAKVGHDLEEAVRQNASSPVFVALQEGRVIGTVQAVNQSPPAARWFAVGMLAVDPAHRGRGVGHALMRHVEGHICREWMRGQGGTIGLMDETKKMNSGSRFYEKMGYALEDRPRYDEKGVCPVLVKKISAQEASRPDSLRPAA